MYCRSPHLPTDSTQLSRIPAGPSGKPLIAWAEEAHTKGEPGALLKGAML